MKRNPAVALLFMMSLITLLFVGCATVTFDQLPDNVPRGYVEFYSKDVAGIRNQAWFVSKYEDRKETKTATRWHDWQRLRIAERPGMHTFIVSLGSAWVKKTVHVIEGMIIPVGIIINRTREESRYNETIVHFKLSLSVEKPTPFVK